MMKSGVLKVLSLNAEAYILQSTAIRAEFTLKIKRKKRNLINIRRRIITSSAKPEKRIVAHK
uniref:hypothetical protein n=1 Tax=Mesosutterella multiformis TaxID=2259133 RepID=UPI004028A4A0